MNEKGDLLHVQPFYNVMKASLIQIIEIYIVYLIKAL